MKVIEATNVNDAYRAGIDHLMSVGMHMKVRGGRRVIVAPTPVVTVYSEPMQRVLFDVRRRANPFFHFFESLWMLAGRDDVAYLEQFNKNIKQFSDDGIMFHGAYGHRIRKNFLIDQFDTIVKLFTNSPNTRRGVIQIWDCTADLDEDERDGSLDVPCNDLIIFDQKMSGVLDMTVCNRSNDIIWGCYGANAVHFSYIHEYVASRIGFNVGTYYQMSNNYHAYVDDKAPSMEYDEHMFDPYSDGTVEPRKLIDDPDTFDSDLKQFLVTPWLCTDSRNRIFTDTALPMFNAWKNRRDGKIYEHFVQDIAASDWQLACINWLESAKARRNKNGG